MRIPDLLVQAAALLHESFVDGEAVDISATDHTFKKPTRAIYVGGAGNIIVTLVSGRELTFMAAPVGTTLKVAAVKITRTSTTATLMVGLY